MVALYKERSIILGTQNKILKGKKRAKELRAMTKIISNVNKYLSEMKIKQSYLSMVTGIDKNKMSRLLTGYFINIFH